MKPSPRPFCLLALLLLFWCRGIAAEAGYGFAVKQAELTRQNNEYLLNAVIDYRFSEPAIEALRSGVPLTLALKLRITRERGYWWDDSLVNERWVFRIRYHSLTKMFQLIQESSGVLRNFASFDALLDSMGVIRGWTVMPADRLRKGERYRARLSVSLDKEALPLPLRPLAYVTSAWYLSSPWYKWSFED